MAVIPGSWAGMIPFFPSARCGCWAYSLPNLNNLDGFPTDPWTVLRDGDAGSASGHPGSFPNDWDTQWILFRSGLGTCASTGYTATLTINPFPPGTISALEAITAAAVVGEVGAGLVSTSFAQWSITWSGISIFAQITANSDIPTFPVGSPREYWLDSNWQVTIDAGITATLDGVPWAPGTYSFGPSGVGGTGAVDNSFAGLWELSYPDGGTQADLFGGAGYYRTGDTGSFNTLVAGMTFEQGDCFSFSESITGVMGGVWDTPYDSPMTYDPAGNFYWPGVQSSPLPMYWPTPFSGFQSISATVANFGPLDQPGDILMLWVRSTDPATATNGLRFFVEKFQDPINGAVWTWYVQADGVVLASNDTAPPDDPIGYIFWPYSDPVTFTLESDVNGAYRVLVDGAVLYAGLYPDQPVGATQVGFAGETGPDATTSADTMQIVDVQIIAGQRPPVIGDSSSPAVVPPGVATPAAIELEAVIPSIFAAPATIAARASVPTPYVSTDSAAAAAGTSQLRVGWVHTHQDTKPPGAARLAILATSAPIQGQHIQGFGAGALWPIQSGGKNWGDLDRILGTPGHPELGYMKDATQRIVYLLACPAWMKVPKPGTSITQLIPLGDPGHEYVPYEPPHRSQYPAFASLAAQIVTRYTQVTHVVIWNEGKGFFIGSSNRWDYEDYTEMYNQCYTAIKAARPSVKVGGPYFVLRTLGWSDRAHWSSELNGAWGHADSRIVDVMKYWLTHATGADFFAMDLRNSNSDYAQNDFDAPTFTMAQWATNPEHGANPTYWPINPWKSWSKLGDIMDWFRAQPRLGNLPFYYMEFYANALVNNFNSNFPSDPQSSVANMASVAAEGMRQLALNGYAGTLFWRPDGDSGGRANPLALYNSSATATLMAPICAAMKDHFGPGVAIFEVAGLPAGITALWSATHILAISANSTSTTFTLDGHSVTLSAYEVRLVVR